MNVQEYSRKMNGLTDEELEPGFLTDRRLNSWKHLQFCKAKKTSLLWKYLFDPNSKKTLFERFLITSAEAINFLATQGHSHNDIKTTNFLVTTKNGRAEFFLSDFGLTDKERGGTPIFASPEALGKEKF